MRINFVFGGILISLQLIYFIERKLKTIIHILIAVFSWQSMQAMTMDTVQADEIVVSASRIPKVYSETIRKIELINKSAIESGIISGIDDILEMQSAVDIRSRGSFGIQSDINIRGGNHNQALVLLNGFPMNDPQTGHHNINLPISQHDISRIELLEGSGSRVLGPNAYNGAINFDVRPLNNDMTAKISFGEFNLFEGYLKKDFSFDAFKTFVSVSKQSSKGYTDNTDFDILNLLSSGSYLAEFGTFEYIVGFNNKKFGANSFYTATYPNQYEHTRSLMSGLGFRTGTDLIYEVKAFWKRHQDRFELFRHKAKDWYLGHNYHLSNVYNLSNNLAIVSDLGISDIGFDIKHEHIYSNVLGDDMDTPIDVPYEENVQFTKEIARLSLSAFGEHNVSISGFDVSAGLMLFSNDYYGTELYPGIDLSYGLTENIKIGASLNRNMRLPTFTELYYDGPTNIGNPDLNPETSIEYEAGLKYLSESNSIALSIFRSEGNDIIDWVKKPEDVEWTTSNLTELIKNGISISYSFKKQINLSSFMKVRNFRLSYTYLDIEKSSSEYISYYVLDYLKHKFTAGMNIKFFEELVLSLSGNYQNRNGTYTNTDNLETEYDQFFLIDTKLHYSFSNISLSLICKNLTDEKYRDISSVVMPGRWVKFEVGYKIDFE